MRYSGPRGWQLGGERWLRGFTVISAYRTTNPERDFMSLFFVFQISRLLWARCPRRSRTLFLSREDFHEP